MTLLDVEDNLTLIGLLRFLCMLKNRPFFFGL